MMPGVQRCRAWCSMRTATRWSCGSSPTELVPTSGQTDSSEPVMNRLHAIAFGGIAHALLLQPAWSVDERHWRTPNPVERHDSGDASTPQFAFDHNGNAVAVWLLLDGESGQIWASRYTVVTKTWAPPTQID